MHVPAVHLPTTFHLNARTFIIFPNQQKTLTLQEVQAIASHAGISSICSANSVEAAKLRPCFRELDWDFSGL